MMKALILKLWNNRAHDIENERLHPVITQIEKADKVIVASYGHEIKGVNMAIISSKNAKHYSWGGNCDGWYLAESEKLSVIQERMPKGASEVRHLHNKSEQFFYIISGIATLEVAGVIYDIHPNEGFHIPAEVAHTLSNKHETDLEFLVISTPPSHGDRVNA